MFCFALLKKPIKLTMSTGVVLGALLGTSAVNIQLPETFHFDEERATFLYALSQFKGNCEIHVVFVAKEHPRLIFQFVRDGKQLLSILGHTHSVFCSGASERVLLFADFDPSTSGCSIVAYDIQLGRRLWKTRLRGLGKNLSGPNYANSVSIGIGPDQIFVAGHETSGDYVEILDQRSGNSVAHKIYRQNVGADGK